MGLLLWALTSLDIPNSNRTNYGKKAQHKANPRRNDHSKHCHKLFIFQIISPFPFPDSGIRLRGIGSLASPDSSFRDHGPIMR